ncbi:MAG: FapA family protein [Sulfuritalea sp.]|nr:FapA family protein [Sulfuritalea sp.]
MEAIPGLEFSESEGRLFAAILPITERPPLDVDALKSLIEKAGYGDWFLLEDALEKLVGCYHLPNSELNLPLAERRDGSFTLEISEDAMFAWIDFVPASGGKAVTHSEIFAALDSAGVTYGIDPLVVEALCSSTTAERRAVATGEAAENGRDTIFEQLVADARDRVPQVDENGLINYRELGAIPMVVADQELMRRIPPTTGSNGRNVHGGLVEPVPGRNEAFVENLAGAHIAKDDANLLRATFNGQPIRCGNGVMVEQVLHAKNVDIASGNISFDGTVHIDGEVLPGMKVHATGDIIVTGLVDGAELDAGGDITIGGGVIAQARVRAGGSVSARFVESAHVYSGTMIAIDDAALQSDLQAINQIVVGIKATQRGHIVGGSARAMLLIRAPIVGAAKGGVTEIQLGVNPVLEAKYQELLQRIEAQKTEEANLEKLVKHLTTHGDKGGMLGRAKASWQQAIQAWAKLMPEQEALEAQLALIGGAQLEVGVSVSGAINLHFGKKTLTVRKNYDAGVFSLVDEKIVFTDPGGVVTTAG